MARLFSTGNYISAGNSSILNPGSISISAWFYNTDASLPYQMIARRNTGNVDPGNDLYLVGKTGGTTQKMAYYWSNSTTNALKDPGTNTYSTNVWNHVWFDYDETTHTAGAYLNGILDAGPITTGTGPLRVGSTVDTWIGKNDGSGSNEWQGRIADVAIWNIGTISESEISAIAKGVRPYLIRPANLIGWWPIDGIVSPEPDLSGNALNATLTGTPPSAFGPPIAPLTRRWPQLLITPPPDVFIAAGDSMYRPRHRRGWF